MLTLAHPWLLLLVPLPWILGRFLPAYREPKPALRVPFLERLAGAAGREVGRKRASAAVVSRVQSVQIGAVWVLAVLALARPQWVGEAVTRSVPSRDLALAVDLSGSMEARDVTDGEGRPTDRLSAVKDVLDEFLQRREGDRVGLVFFGSAPFVQVPFTEDLEACRILLDEAQVRMAGPRTVIGDAIGTAIKLFEQSEFEERVVVLLTDGNDTGSHVPPENAARIAAEQGIVIHPIAFGDPTSTGEEAFDEAVLRTVAETTGGRYFAAADRDQLESIYEELDRLDTREIESISHRPTSELYWVPLAALAVLNLLYHFAQALRQAARMARERRRMADPPAGKEVAGA